MLVRWNVEIPKKGHKTKSKFRWGQEIYIVKKNRTLGENVQKLT